MIVPVCLSVSLSVCVCVCVVVCPRSYIRNYTFYLQQFSVHVTYDRGSVLLWRRSDTLCTSGFNNDVISACSLVEVARRRRPVEAQRTRSLGLGYKLCAVIPFAGQRTTFWALEVTSQM